MFEIADRAQVPNPHSAHCFDAAAVSDQDMMHGMCCGSNIPKTGGVLAYKVRQPGYAPWFVDRRNTMCPVSDTVHDHLGEIRKPMRYIRVLPPSQICQSRWHFPVIQRHHWLQTPRQHTVDKPVIEIQSIRICGSATFREHARPAGGKSVCVQAHGLHQIQIFLPPQVVFASPTSMLRANDISRCCRKCVPMG